MELPSLNGLSLPLTDNIYVAGFIGSPRMNVATGEFAKPYNGHSIGGCPDHLGSDTFLHIHVEGIGLITDRVGVISPSRIAMPYT